MATEMLDAYKFALEWSKQEITLATGLLAVMITFTKDLVKRVNVLTAVLLGASWLCLIISIANGTRLVGLLTAALEAISARSVVGDSAYAAWRLDQAESLAVLRRTVDSLGRAHRTVDSLRKLRLPPDSLGSLRRKSESLATLLEEVRADSLPSDSVAIAALQLPVEARKFGQLQDTFFTYGLALCVTYGIVSALTLGRSDLAFSKGRRKRMHRRHVAGIRWKLLKRGRQK